MGDFGGSEGGKRAGSQGAASGRGEGEARSLCWGSAVSYFPFWSLQGFVGVCFFCFVFFLCRSCLVREQTCIYFQCEFCKWKKTNGGKKKIKKTPGAKKSAVFMGNKEFFPQPVPLHPRSGVSTLPGVAPSSHPAPARLNPLRRFPTGRGGCWKSPSCSRFLFESSTPRAGRCFPFGGEQAVGRGRAPSPLHPAGLLLRAAGFLLLPRSEIAPWGSFLAGPSSFGGFGAWLWWP